MLGTKLLDRFRKKKTAENETGYTIRLTGKSTLQDAIDMGIDWVSNIEIHNVKALKGKAEQVLESKLFHLGKKLTGPVKHEGIRIEWRKRGGACSLKRILKALETCDINEPGKSKINSFTLEIDISSDTTETRTFLLKFERDPDFTLTRVNNSIPSLWKKKQLEILMKFPIIEDYGEITTAKRRTILAGANVYRLS